MDVDFAVLADGVAQRPDGKLDIFGAAFDTVFATSVPAMHPQMALAVRLLMSRQEAAHQHTVDVILLEADGLEITKARGVLQVSQADLDRVPAGRRIAVGAVLQFSNVIFPRFGAYHFVVHWDGTEARTPISLYVAQAPGSELPQTPSDE